MKLLPRRNAETTADVVTDVVEPATVVGKGRATPKRRDSAVQRGPVSAPKTRKEAYARQKQVKAAKGARQTATKMTAQQRREALRAGDPAFLPRRDQGPTRKLARDYVDSHRMFSNYLLVLFPLMVVSYLVPAVQFLVLFVFFALLVEWYLTGRRVHRLAVERNGSAQGSALSIGFYAGSRAYLLRRWRLPAPQKALGDTI
ncbi:MAG: DUF3043 domain-containing protein [Pseudonocardiales bacterium]|nr:MAG: DUF3043 domain-containing protein [Pseudonocardiales bacterium]